MKVMWAISIHKLSLLTCKKSVRWYFKQTRTFPSNPNDYLQGIRRAVLQKIHPDLFTSVSSDIQQQNVQCIHEFNELWSILAHLCGLVTSSNVTSSSGVRTIVKPKYKFSCFIHPSDPNQELKRVESIITMPSPFCGSLVNAQGLSRDALYEHSIHVLRQKHAFTQQLEIANPWSDFLDADGFLDGNSSSRRGENKSNPSLDMYIFDTVAKSAQSNNFVANQRTSHHQYAVQLQQIEDYLGTEHIQFLDVEDSEEQLLVAQRLAGFLTKYGDMVSFFSPTVWKHIILVIRRGIGRESTEYSVRKEGEYYIVTIPHRFKPAQLADYLHAHVPATLPELKWR